MFLVSKNIWNPIKFIFIFLFFTYALSASTESIKTQTQSFSYDIEHYYDSDNTQTISTIKSQRFMPTSPLVRFFRQNKPHWFKFTLKNHSDAPTEIIISNSKNNHNIFSFYKVSENKKVIDTSDMSKFINYNERDYRSNIPAYSVLLEKNSTTVVYVKLQKDVNVISQFNVQTPHDFNDSHVFSDHIYVTYIGSTLTIGLYFLILFFISRSKIYIYYFFFIIFINNYTFVYSNLYFYFFDAYYLPFVMSFIPLIYVMLVYVTQEILKGAGKKLPYFDRITSFFKVSLIALCFLLYFNPSLASAILYIFTVLFFFYAIYMLIFSQKQHKLYFVALLVFFSSVLSVPLFMFGVLEYNSFTKYIAITASGIEIIMFATILAHRINQTHIQREALSLELAEVQKNQNESLTKQVNAKTLTLNLLYKELQHRVKNNFQFILTFLYTQQSLTKDSTSIALLQQTTDRIYAISSLHETLSTDDITNVPLKDYIEKILLSFKQQSKDIKTSCEITEITISYQDAMALGLILNELLTNSLKYAFVDIQNPSINISILKEDEKYSLYYEDSGNGFNTENLESTEGLGYELISEFSKQFPQNKMTIKADGRFSFRLEFILNA